jgi:ABC-2 type transport system permease protein
MRNALTIARRELGVYLVSPVTYVVTVAMLAIFGYSFYLMLYVTREASLRPLFGGNIAVALTIAVPLLTMRLLAEEERSGALEILLTLPVRDWEVILGKYLAGLCSYVAALAPTIYYPIVLEILGSPDWGAILSIYLGLGLLGAALVSLGILTSTLNSNQFLAAGVGMLLALLLWMLPAAGERAGPPVRDILRYLGLSTHFDSFARGVIDTSALIYYLSVAAGGLFLATRTLRARR